ncbi:MAG: RNA methyltransferase [Bacteroidota bacterium]
MLSKNQIKFIKSLSLKKNRWQHQLFTVEGAKGIMEFLKSDFECHGIYTTNDQLFNEFETSLISESDLKRISQLKTPNQALALFKIPAYHKIVESNIMVALDDIKDPGNLGTIIRLCDWFGITDILCSKETVDCYNSKVVQASMGSLSRVKLHYLNLLSYLTHYDGEVYGTFLHGHSIYSTNFKEKSILLMGNEANGISADLINVIGKKVTVPQYGKMSSTESLNVATATAICLGEIRRSSAT